MSKAIPIFTGARVRWLAPLATFAALLAVLTIANDEAAVDPVAALGPAVSAEGVAPATADGIEALESAVRA